jgi:peptidoglycan hydrolase CwlO-like protein
MKIFVPFLFMSILFIFAEAKEPNRDYTEKNEFIEKTKVEVDHLKNDLLDLEVRAEHAKGTAKKEAKEKIQSVKTSIRKLNDEIDELKYSTEDNWGKVKSKYEESVSNIKDAIVKSRVWLSDKIAP